MVGAHVQDYEEKCRADVQLFPLVRESQMREHSCRRKYSHLKTEMSEFLGFSTHLVPPVTCGAEPTGGT